MAETADPDQLLEPLDDAGWAAPTPAPEWAVRDQASQLAFLDEAALLSMTDRFLKQRDEQHGVSTDREARRLPSLEPQRFGRLQPLVRVRTTCRVDHVRAGGGQQAVHLSDQRTQAASSLRWSTGATPRSAATLSMTSHSAAASSSAWGHCRAW
jgi:hypothetical protein